jgi:hypothetical protein
MVDLRLHDVLLPVFAVLGELVCFYAISLRVPTLLKVLLSGFNVGFILALPYLVSFPNTWLEVVLRVGAGFNAMKVTDLCIGRVHNPPILLSQGGLPKSISGRLYHAYRLLKETRYESFNISTVRPRQNTWNLPYHIGVYTIIPLLNYLLPHIAEVKILVVLLTTHTTFEAAHKIIRPSSRTPLFCEPLSAPDLTSFWRHHWHAMILSPVNTLAFDPLSRVAGRSLGVVGAFALSGAWHGWAVIPWDGYTLALKVGMMFVMQGVGCLLEWGIWGRRKTLAKRACAWVWALGWAGWALRGWKDRQQYGL